MPQRPMTKEQLVRGLGRLVEHYVDGAPDPDVLIRSLGTLTAYTLAMLVRSARMLPDDIEDLLADFCTTLRHLTCTIIHDEDSEEPL